MSRAGRVMSLGLVAAAYFYVFPYQPVINNPNENVRFYMTVAIVDHGTFAIDAVEKEWGWVNDKARRGAHVYSVKAPGTSYLGVPAYVGYRLYCLATKRAVDRTEALWACRAVASIVPTLFFLAFFARFLQKRATPLTQRAMFFAVALGSGSFAYALLFVSHTLAACSAFAALGILAYLDSYRAAGLGESPWLALWAGLFAAATTAFEYPGVIATIALSAYAIAALRPRGRLLWFAAGAAIPTGLVMLFQWRAFGNPFTPGHRFLDNPAYRALAREGFFGASGFDLRALGLLGDPGYGLFMLSPLLLAAPVGFVVMLASKEQRRQAIVALVITLGTIAAITLMNNWRGGWTVGPRYLVTIIPFVAWAAAVGWDRIARPLPRVAAALVVGLGAAGIVAGGVPSAIYPHVPEAFRRPLPDLFAVLVRHGFAPYTLGGMLGLGAKASLIPLAALGAIAALVPLGAVHGIGRKAYVLVLATLFFACALAAPARRSPPNPRTRASLAHVTKTWSPRGRDAAALLGASLEGRRDPSGRRRLARIYRALGRDREAVRAEREADRIR